MASVPPVLANITYDNLLVLARQRTFEASQGRLNDTSEAGVLTAILRQQCQAIVDQNRLLNQVPEIATLMLLKSMGAGLSPGTQARVEVTIVLTEVLTTPATIQRFRIARSGISFTVAGNQDNQSLILVPAGASSITVIAIANVFGVAGNVSPGVWQILEPQPLVQSVVSGEAAVNGSDPESLASIPSQVLADRLSAGSLTRKADFERELREVLGAGSTALAIGKLGPDRTTKQLGAVHVFGLNGDGSELTQPQIQAAQLQLNQGSPLADIYVSSIEIFELKASVILVLAAGADPQIVSRLVWDTLKSAISPTSLAPGEAVYVNAAVVAVGKIEGVERVQSVAIGEFLGVPQPTNQPLPYPWSAPRLDAITVRCVFGRNETIFTFPT
jgi:hypothetical protein